MADEFNWLRKRKKTEAELPLEPPICLTDKSNGEFYWRQTPYERRVREEILRQCDDNARKLGMDRREFMASAMGMATSLSVLNFASGCSDDGNASGNKDAGPDGGVSTGGYCIPKGTTLDCDAASELLGGDEFIFDLQTHHIVDEEMWRESHPGQAYFGDRFFEQWRIWHAECGMKNHECIGPDKYLEDIYMNSDTTVGVLSGFPTSICDDATLCEALISNNDMVATRDRINVMAGSQRVVQHCQVMPNDQLELQLEMMERIHENYGNYGWKCYPPAGGWWLDDEDSGIPFIEKARELTANNDECGPRTLICAHKGLPLQGFDREHGDPKDMMVVAKRFPDVDFIAYHSAIHHNEDALNFAAGEGPYDPDGLVDPENPTKFPVDRSANILVHRVVENDLKGKNVYAELGSAWMLVMNFPTAAGHLLGKLLKYIGEDNVLWGTECIWFASPQPQIEAFRAFQIPEELQEQYGYPALTPEIKAKIFGLNAARLYGIDPEAKRCAIEGNAVMSSLREQMDGELGKRRWAFQSMQGPRSPREFANLVRWERFKDGLG